MPPVWLELHLDDEVLSAAPGRYPEARALLVRVAEIAEAQGARLSLRVRETFADRSRSDGLLPRLAAAGHEVGAHAHGQGLAAVRDALQAAGVAPEVCTPGLVQVGPHGRAILLQQAAALGYRRVTDHGMTRAWAYEGLLPRVEEGLWVMAPTVRPPDWGLYGLDGARSPLDAEAVAALRALERRAFDDFGALAFGAALHEHDLCAPGRLDPLPSALDALAALLDARVQPSGRIPAVLPPPPQPRRALDDRWIPLARAVGFTTALARRVRKGRPTLPPPGGVAVPVAGGRGVVVERHGPPDPAAVVVVSHAGARAGRRVALAPFGLGLRDVVGLNCAVYLYDRAGTGRSPAAGPLVPGNPAHDADWRAVLALAREEGAPVVALSFSSGLLPVLRAAAAGARPDAVVDAEAPADRWSLVPPDGGALAGKDPWRDRAWAGLEAVALIPDLGVPYARVQGALDHVHGAMTEHARRLVAAAQRAGLPVLDTGVQAGPLHGSPQITLDALRWAVAAVSG